MNIRLTARLLVRVKETTHETHGGGDTQCDVNSLGSSSRSDTLYCLENKSQMVELVNITRDGKGVDVEAIVFDPRGRR